MRMEGGSGDRVLCNEMVIYVDDCRSSYTGFKKPPGVLRDTSFSRTARIRTIYYLTCLVFPAFTETRARIKLFLFVRCRWKNDTCGLDAKRRRFRLDAYICFVRVPPAGSRFPLLPTKANPPICAGKGANYRSYIRLYVWDYTHAFPCFLVQKFVEKFSRELNMEYGGKGKNGSNIVVQCIMPGYVATNMSKITKTSWMVPSPDKFVRSALQTTGIEPVTTGYLPHTLMVSVLLPHSPSGNAFFLLFSSVFHFRLLLRVETVVPTLQRQLVIDSGSGGSG